MVARSRP